MDELRQALAYCWISQGQYPPTKDGLRALIAARIITKVPVDGWQNEIMYVRVGTGFRLTSYGSDGMAGGTGFAEDIQVEITNPSE